MLVLTANKTKMLALVRAQGFDPPRNATFTKAFHDRHWWLEWGGDHFYRVSLGCSAGRAFFATEIDGKWNCQALSMEDLKKFDLVEEISEKSRPLPQPEPDYEYEPEL